MPWVDVDDGKFTDVRRGLIDADEAGAEVDGGLLNYVVWGLWGLAGLSVATALAAVRDRRRMSTGTRVALTAVVFGVIAVPIVLLTVIAQGINGGGNSDASAVTAGVLVAVVMVALFAASTFVPAPVMTATAAGVGVLWHVHALNELSDGGTDLELGAVVGGAGYVALAVAAVAGRRRRWPGKPR